MGTKYSGNYRFRYFVNVDAIDEDGNSVDTLPLGDFTRKDDALRYARSFVYKRYPDPARLKDVKAFLGGFEDVLPLYYIDIYDKNGYIIGMIDWGQI